jgi:hypothetical protein
MAHYGDPYKGLMAFSEELCSALRESRPFNLPTGAVLVLEEEESGVEESINDDASGIDDFETEDIEAIADEGFEVDESIDDLEKPEETKPEPNLE